MKQIITKTCKHCGRTFRTRNLNQIYCNLGCESDDKPEEPWGRKKANNPNQTRVDGKFAAKKTCKLCGKEFVPPHKLSEYCSEECKKKQHSNENLNYIAKKKEALQNEAIITETPVTEPLIKNHLLKTCLYCAKEFVANSQRQRYCTRKCAQNHLNERKRGHGREVICKVCGKSFTTRLPRQCYCSDGCRMDYKRQKAREYSDRYKKRVNTIMNLNIENETVKQITNAAKSRIINESIDSVTDTAPYLAETNLANYITELEQKLEQIDNNNKLYKQMIDDNNRERVWLSEHIDRLKHIIVCEGHKCRPQNSASVTEQ